MAFNLTKMTEAAETRLRGRGFTLLKDDKREGLKLRVRLAMDGSGSTRKMWLDGTMQAALQAVLPTALTVDDDGDMPVAVFNEENNFTLLPRPMTRLNYSTYVADEIVDMSQQSPRVPLWGGTDYSPVLRAILADEGFVTSKRSAWGIGAKRETVVSKPNEAPTIVYFFTDGDCSDKDRRETQDLLNKVQDADCAVYVLLIGVGDAGFRFLSQIGDALSNVGFVAVRDLEKAVGAEPDEVVRLLLPDEMLKWVAAKRL